MPVEEYSGVVGLRVAGRAHVVEPLGSRSDRLAWLRTGLPPHVADPQTGAETQGGAESELICTGTIRLHGVTPSGSTEPHLGIASSFLTVGSAR